MWFIWEKESKLFYLELETDKENRPFECDILCDPPEFLWCWSTIKCDDLDSKSICIGTECASTLFGNGKTLKKQRD